MNTDDTVTIYDVAREAGALCVRNRYRSTGNKNAKENTRKSFRSDRTLSDYRPNAVARGLVGKENNNSRC